jgi:hypothetical protein
VSVATLRCGIWLTVFCGVLAADRRFFPFRLLRCAQNRGQRARHSGVVGLKGCSEAPKVSSTTGGLPDGKIPTTGSTITEVIGQAEQFAFSVGQSRPTQCRHVYLCSDTCLETRGTFIPKCERKRRGYLLVKTHPYPSIRELTLEGML